MMKLICLCVAIMLSSCNVRNSETGKVAENGNVADSSQKADSGEVETRTSLQNTSYSNARFKDVTIKRNGNTVNVEGKGQIFEANFGWVVEDGHHELKKGFQMTDAGAPAWGNFKFSVDVKKERPSSTLTLILFESSPRDGSRQHELAIPLE